MATHRTIRLRPIHSAAYRAFRPRFCPSFRRFSTLYTAPAGDVYNRHDISLPPLSKFHLSATNYLTCISSPMINLPLSETLASLELAELWNNYSPKEGGGKKRKWRALDVYENNRDNST